MIAEAAETAELVILGAVLWAGVAGGALALVLLVVISAGLPLGVWAGRRPTRGYREACGAPERVCGGFLARMRHRRSQRRSDGRGYREAA